MITSIKFGKNTFNRHTAYILFLSVIILMILVGMTYPIVSLCALFVLSAYILTSKNNHAVCIMYFLLPFANIFKLSPESTSLFTILTILLLAKLIISIRTITKGFLFTWIIMLMIQVIGCNFDFTLLIKQAIILPLIYGYFHSSDQSLNDVTMNFASGLLVSSFLALMKNFIPGMQQYVRIVRAYDISIDTYRFTGLYSDPNYLSICLILCSILLFILISQKKIKKTNVIFILAFVYFGILTISKSFFLMLVIVFVIIEVMLIKKRKFGYASVLMVGILVALTVMLFTNAFGIFDNIFVRLTIKGTFTTGRSKIWASYMDLFLENPIRWFFGYGIGAALLDNMAAHNTYIDFLYFYGIIGTLVMLLGIKFAVGKQKLQKGIFNIGPLICFLFLVFALSLLQMYDFAYLLILVLSNWTAKWHETPQD